jgi:ribosomal protein S12 methylthiotransferase accessory factor YcaO
MSHSRVRQMAQAMGTQGYGLWTDAEVAAVLALGEVGQSRAQELIGRNITESEAQEVING